MKMVNKINVAYMPQFKKLAGVITPRTATDIMELASSGMKIKGSSTGKTTLASANASANDYVITFPAETGTLITTAGPAASITVANEATDTSCYPVFVTDASGNLGPKSNAGLTFNSSTAVLTATGFAGPLTGDVTGNCSGTAATVTGATQANITTCANLTTVGTIGTGVWQGTTIKANYLQNAAADLGAADVNINLGNTNGAFVTNLTTDGTITATVGFAGPLTGNVTGDVSGSSGSCTGNAATVTGFTPASGSLTLAGADALTLTTTADTNVTLPTTGTLATTSDLSSYLPLVGGSLTGGLTFADPGTSANSHVLTFTADNAATPQVSTIYTAYGADPYMIISPSNAAGSATAAVYLHSDRMVLVDEFSITTNTTDDDYVLFKAVDNDTQVLTEVARMTGAATPTFDLLAGRLTGTLNANSQNIGTVGVLTTTTIELGDAADTTLARVSAGVISVEGATILVSGGALGTPASGTLTNCTGYPGIVSWSEITSDGNIVVNTGSLANKGTLLTLTLPAASSVGAVVRVAGMNAGLRKIAQGANQYIKFGDKSTTTGAGGYLSSTFTYDTIELVCIVANLGRVVTSSVGNITIV